MKSRENELLIIYLLIDLVLLNLAILFMAYFRMDISKLTSIDFSIYIINGNLSWIITYFLFSKRNLYLRDGYINRVLRISKRTLIFLVVSAVITFLFMPYRFSRTFFMEYAILFYIGKLIFYWFLYKYLRNNREKGIHINRIVIVGINETSNLLREIIEINPILGFKFLGYIDYPNSGQTKLLGTPEELPALIEKHQIQIIFVSQSMILNADKEKEYLRICQRMGVRLRIIPENQRWYRSHINLESVGNIVLINPQEIPLDKAGARIGKRLFDIAFSLTFIILIYWWLLPIMAILIKFSSRGPVFFVQKRTGFNNKPFSCLKFRSMKVNKQSNIKQATANDSRITWIGNLMRKTNIDEMPQFINVFLGDMSVVGPRPHMLAHTQQYSQLIEHYLIRHYVKPGVTGWAQVNGFRGETDELWKMERRVKYDTEYIENWTFMWDITIIWKTIFGLKSYKNAG